MAIGHEDPSALLELSAIRHLTKTESDLVINLDILHRVNDLLTHFYANFDFDGTASNTCLLSALRLLREASSFMGWG